MKRMKIGDVAKELSLKKSIIRQWESEFRLKTRGQNTYTIDDMKVLVHIKELARTQGLSHDQIKIELEKLPEFSTTPAQKTDNDIKTTIEVVEAKTTIDPELYSQLMELKQGLLRLYKLLA